MQKITYFQAASLLGVKQDTIKHAVFNGKLTRCISPTKDAMVLKEQVMLFKGKKISLKSLTIEEEKLWKEYKKIAESSELLELATKEDQTNDPAHVLIAKEVAKLQYEEKLEKIEHWIYELDKVTLSLKQEVTVDSLPPQMPLALKRP